MAAEGKILYRIRQEGSFQPSFFLYQKGYTSRPIFLIQQEQPAAKTRSFLLEKSSIEVFFLVKVCNKMRFSCVSMDMNNPAEEKGMQLCVCPGMFVSGF
mgnify:CR=1 FL=1